VSAEDFDDEHATNSDDSPTNATAANTASDGKHDT
jgi:hypothetical protein